MEKKKKMVLLIVAILSMSVVSIIYYAEANNGEVEIPYDNNSKGTQYNYTGGIDIIPGKYLEPKYNDKTGDYRPEYELSKKRYLDIFGELPPFPEDFFDISSLIYSGRITDYSRIDKEYYLQPEFYPAWFSAINESYIYNDPLRWTTQGYGCYPCIKEVEVPKGKTVVINTYFRTGYATESYQGLIIHPYLPDVAKDMRGNTMFEQSSNVDKYLSVRITNPDNPTYEKFKDELLVDNVGEEDWFVILKPTYQVITDKYGKPIGETGFPNDWVRILELEITISSSIPSGDYVVAIEPVVPCFEINQEFYYSQNHEYYGRLYIPAGSYFLSEKPHFQTILRIK